MLAEDENFDPILNADSLQGSMQFGAKANIDFREVKPWLGGTDLHFGYFGINSLDAGTRVDALQVRSIFFQAYPQNPPPSFDFTYSSNLYSVKRTSSSRRGRESDPSLAYVSSSLKILTMCFVTRRDRSSDFDR